MDAIVKQAMAKWPEVPDCYGWLTLDARGNWRMRDELAQTQQLAGARIANRALLDFINRNYLHDDNGRWYFQNGPQRVFVDLETMPHIARTNPAQGFVLHTEEVLSEIEAAWMSAAGELVLQSASRLALLDDRDLAQCMQSFRANEINGSAVSDEDLLAWLEDGPSPNAAMYLSLGARLVPVHKLHYPVRDPQFARQFGLIRQPRPAGS